MVCFQKYTYDLGEIDKITNISNYQHLMIVCGNSMINSHIISYFKSLNIKYSIFKDFKPNPLYEDVVKGVKFFKDNDCDFIIGLGGGSALDVSKCIKAFLKLDVSINYLEQEILDCEVPLLAIPSTAGTGSEATHFAVIYQNGEKCSVEHSCLLPNYVLLDYRLLEGLPLYQKKSTLLDALCQSIESYWSVNSTDESKKYASEAIKLILDNYERYIAGNQIVYKYMIKASNLSGKAINISKTTAAHAMSYKLTSLYGVSHGHAVALCLPIIWNYMVLNIDKCCDYRGSEYLSSIFKELNVLFGTDDSIGAINRFVEIFNSFNIESKIVNRGDLDILINSVNVERLNNNPVSLEKDVIRKVYGMLC